MNVHLITIGIFSIILEYPFNFGFLCLCIMSEGQTSQHAECKHF